MLNSNNTFKITIFNKDGTSTESIVSGPITFSISSNSSQNEKYCFLRMRQFSEGYDIEKILLYTVGAGIVKNLDREKMDSLDVSFLTSSGEYRTIFNKKLDNIDEINFEYSTDIDYQEYTDTYNSVIDFVIKYFID